MPGVPLPSVSVPGGGGGGGGGGSGDGSGGGSGGSSVGSGGSTVNGSQGQARATTRAARKKAVKRQADATPMIAGTKAAENLVDDESSPELYGRASRSCPPTRASPRSPGRSR